ncbi:MAG TPA: DUF4394 domain-containing protein [Pyrinomonadaceae bacterium]
MAILLLLMGASVSRAVPVIGLTNDEHLIFFDSSAPHRIVKRVALSKSVSRAWLAAIDLRPSTGELYGLSMGGVLYRIDQDTGDTVAVGTRAFTLFADEGYDLGMDFDPVTDELRVTTLAGRSFRINPDTGALIAFDRPLEFAPGEVNTGRARITSNVAYSNNHAGATSTTLYAIKGAESLARIGSPGGNPHSPDTGQVFTVGSLGLAAKDLGFSTFAFGFDIAPGENTALMVAYSSDDPATTLQNLYSIDLKTGAATLLGGVGAVGSREFLSGMTIGRVMNSVPMLALTKTNKLLRFQSATPGHIQQTLTITGLPAGESLVAIDLRNATGELYGLSDAARLYHIQTAVGATFAVATPASPAGLFAPNAADGYGFDFNPANDQLRVVNGATGENLRFAPDTGALLSRDPQLAYAAGDQSAGHAPRVNGAAYAREFVGVPSTVTTLYGIDSARDALVRHGSRGGSPISGDTGQLFTVGSLGFDAPDALGFDIDFSDGTAYAVFKVADGARPVLHTVNLSTGAAEPIATLNTTEEVRGLAVDKQLLLFFSPTNYTVDEGAGSVAVTVTRTDVTDAASVEYVSVDETASGRKDYSAVHGTLRFAPGEREKTFNIFIADDAFREGSETFSITFNNPAGVVASTVPATVTIVDNEASESSSNPIDDNEFFVRQHYRDFLYREAEPDGLAAWVNVLRRCPNVHNNPLCDRVTVSSAFFRSVEFQDKGYFIYRYYKVGLFGERPRYEDFLRDVRRLEGQTAEEIAAQKNAFAVDWVKRQSFTELYGETSSPRAFLDALVSANGLKLSTAEKESLVADMEAARKTRADVVRHIVELPQVLRDEYDQAFVTMQYFGYLQRDPDEDGFVNWTRYLTTHPGDFRTMVHGFVNSVEYRARFGKP